MKKHLLTSSCSGGGITRLRNNAFTLIELLAIIVILAIIAVITVPIILNIIENSRKGAATDSAYGYKDSVNKYYISELQNHNKLKLDGKYTVNSNGSLTPAEDNTFGFGDENVTSFPVQVSGTVPSSGELTYDNNVLKSGYLVIGDYRVTFNEGGTVTTVRNDGSSSNEQGSGNETPVAQTWNKYYTYAANYDEDTEEESWDYIIATNIDNSWNLWIQENTQTSERELCRLFNNEPVCFNPNSIDLEDFGEAGEPKGSILEKAEEIQAKGVNYGYSDGVVYFDGGIISYADSVYLEWINYEHSEFGIYCKLYYSGNIECRDSNF